MIKLFAFDIDGTLLDSSIKMPDNNIKALRKLNDSGIKTIFASGRVLSSIRYYQKIIGYDNPIVATNGSMIALASNDIYKTHYIDDDILKELFEFCKELKLEFHFYDEENYYTNRVNLDRIKHLKIDNNYGMNYQVDLIIKEDPVSYLLSQGKSANKFQISGIDKNKLSKEEIVSKVNEKFADKLYITSSGSNLIELSNKNSSKWNSISEICEILGICIEEVAAIGDSYNDIPMVKNAKLGFAMGNANETLKKYADIIVGDNDSSGIVEACDYVLRLNKNV